MFQLKPLRKDAIPGAIAKAERYRLLNDASAAESICRDILDIDPTNQSVLTMLILILTDQFGVSRSHPSEAQELIVRLTSEYDRAYYSGIICERWAKAHLNRSSHGSSSSAYGWFRDAMAWYEKAEPLQPEHTDDAILRWNSCVRAISQHKLEPRHEGDHEPQLLE